MTIEQAFLLAFWGVIGALAAAYAIYRLFNAACDWAARRIERMAAEALGEIAPRTSRYDHLDAEYRAIVAAEQKRD